MTAPAKPRPVRSNAMDNLIAPFDHSDVAKLPEYAAASKALDDLAHAVDRLESVGRERFVEVVRQMAVALPYGDGSQCDHEGIVAPFAAKIEGRWLTGAYHCGECGAVWNCGWGTGGTKV